MHDMTTAKCVCTLKKIFLILLLAIGFELVHDLNYNECHAQYNSLAEREEAFSGKSIADVVGSIVATVINCLLVSVVVNTSQLEQVCIPRMIAADFDDCEGIDVSVSFVPGEAVIVVAALVAAVVLFFTPLAYIVWTTLAVYAVFAVVACLGTYVMAPHEYISKKLKDNKAKVSTDLTAADVPFFYNCRDNAQPTDIDVLKRGDLFKTEYGNMNTSSSPYCVGDAKYYATDQISGIDERVKPGSVVVHTIKILDIITAKSYNKRNDKEYIFTVDDIRKGKTYGQMRGFYRLHNSTVQLCVTALTIVLPVIGGCTYIAPPIEITQHGDKYFEDTRCKYFLSSRSDLAGVGNAILNGSADSYKSSVGLFLRSDLHIISTVVGCIKDVLNKVVLGQSSDVSNTSFLYKVQRALEQIVKVVLVIYISIVGIKIMSAQQTPQTGEIMMYIIKFVFVFVMAGLAGRSIWYSSEQDSYFGKKGLYPMALEAMETLVDNVLQAANSTTAVKMCYHADIMNAEHNVLSQHDIPVSSITGKHVEPTKGAGNVVKMTTWDFLDCKLVNYLNFGSCNYTISGMISLWLPSVCILYPFSFIFAIITLIYVVFLLLTILQFVQLAVVSMFALTILVLVSPIMVCFLLFEYTKQTFQSWFKMLLGYIMFPALIFTFVALMISTFDSIFYGQVMEKCADSTQCTIQEICGINGETHKQQSKSLYCQFAGLALQQNTEYANNPTMCGMRAGHFVNVLTEMHGIPPKPWPSIFHLYRMTNDALEALLQPLLKMMLFTILFYYLISAVLNFIEALLGVYGISGTTPQYTNRVSAAVSTGVKLASMQVGLAKDAAKGLMKRISR